MRAQTASGWEIAGEYIDEAQSAKDDQRPKFQERLEAIHQGQGNVIVVHKLDRFSRNMEETFRYVNELEQYGAGLVCTAQPIDTTNPITGKIVLALMAALSETYLDNLSAETSKGKRARAAAGLPNGILPYGYIVAEKATERGASNRSAAVIVPEEAEAVRLAFDLSASGQCGDAQIARTLNDRGYRFRSKWQPEGGRFNKDSIRVMLSNPFYCGWVIQPTVETSGTWSHRLAHAPRIKGMQTAIIDQEIFDQVQTMRSSRRGETSTGKGRRGPTGQAMHAAYLARRLARCHVCGHRLWGQAAAGRAAHYRCNTSNRGGVCATKRKSLPADVIDQVLGQAVGALQLPHDWQNHVLSDLQGDQPAPATIASQRAAIDRKLAHIKRLLLDGDIDQATYRAERVRLEAEQSTLQPPTNQVDLTRAGVFLQDLTVLWAAANPEEQRKIAASVVTAMYLDPDHPEEIGIQLTPVVEPLMAALPSCIHRVIDGA